METDVAMIKDTLLQMQLQNTSLSNNIDILLMIVAFSFMVAFIILIMGVVKTFWKLGEKKT